MGEKNLKKKVFGIVYLVTNFNEKGAPSAKIRRLVLLFSVTGLLIIIDYVNLKINHDSFEFISIVFSNASSGLLVSSLLNHSLKLPSYNFTPLSINITSLSELFKS